MFPRHVSFCTLALALLAGCTSPPVKKDIDGESFKAGQLLQNDANRAANLAMGDNLESLSRLLDKLYKRNPREWRKTGARSREEAHQNVMEAIVEQRPLIGLGDKRSVAALPVAFEMEFQGDRAGALIYGIGSMLMELYGGTTTQHLLSGLNSQKTANAAWNIEVAAWLLASRTDTSGQPLLLSNEISAAGRNLSFEREFGRMIGRLELLAQTSDESLRRSGINYVQGILAAPIIGLVQFIPLDAATAAASQ
ncbi:MULTISPECIES: hypothetical protein [Pseudomonas]|uniref:hypothetical protein n=1 Tax=Pseudomonas TaxID=286 RepID=UPI0007EE6921|nr:MULTISPECIES: hypothetical protein [Pseudomonas]MDH1072368.1 hypothetical protein [Pseudomonas nitroreducens]NMZ60440.1 hypothetical protein [Pseudomonas nitroreducens]NMZ71950.1 hypothetical protein [Pseudomonas nitroreducens]OBY57868.1 hypothetical protein A9513_006500 [Pseudomonas sp. AU12215]UCL86408.1 hypothetical protein LDJ84_26345 [Pseudomonas sp. HS-18]